MARLNLSKLGNTPFQQLLGHNKTILNAWTMLEDTLFTSSTFTTELKEEIRRTLAFLNGCSYCMAKGMPSHYHTDTRTSIAVSFAKTVCKNNYNIEDSVFHSIKREFTSEEISELCAFICFISACQNFSVLLNLTPSCSIKKI
ncbi:alkylhydroperoxidase family enzyme [Clostridium tetanomorphum]|uniref:Carboxymuconolactone decarboxylase family protein n=1 Tax=Clostridium tetanomorphum TaxID=1553 RepID=A0A923EBD0_CLOTT|nr:carboxymuconolactone decarboxylase family protein [Clostridium tetanomorphum]KAJ51887.1 hypothetical protein CTM_10381 [Clostridium tetanomorphum DSM 665]MBC2398614.1 carboxymuconolactone decarboxylase family protein [Clostridium tetanomorphum]MBP1864109.1 alkylhydroperoxidase family enzyme [Clostridium tetanomorphum]NRS84522.1 alkylhydroperoxidase family enzyme [Clostridium tetanomorphum]NRZ97736.1 alkylhydroperoxidase family enzyme [Clostridium tetanomorphum]